MTSEERLRILGPAVVAQIHRRVALAPPPPPDFVEWLRRFSAPVVAKVIADEQQRTRSAEAAPQQPHPARTAA